MSRDRSRYRIQWYRRRTPRYKSRAGQGRVGQGGAGLGRAGQDKGGQGRVGLIKVKVNSLRLQDGRGHEDFNSIKMFMLSMGFF